jgi:NAD(P)-dependent dehydrogenase (short-subunit alcohol dehydrogenase family)
VIFNQYEAMNDERRQQKMFEDKVAIVTGSGSGIGRSTAELYARERASVVVADVDQEGGRETVDLIHNAGGQAIFVKTDVSNPADCEAMVRTAVEEFGRLDYACNNAGIAGEQKPTAEYSIEGWQALISVNLSGVFYCMKYEIPAMLASGGGAIVNMASILGTVGFAGSPAYVSSKHGVIGLTENVALEYGRQGIRANAVGPGFIRTPMISILEQDPDVMQQIVALHPIGRLGKPEEVAELVIWLSSDKAAFMTGGYYAVDGGYLAR